MGIERVLMDRREQAHMHNATTHMRALDTETLKSFKRTGFEIFALNIMIPLLALASISICLLPQYGIVPAWVVFVANIMMTTQIAIMTHELIHEPNSKTNWNLPLRINFHVYSPFTVGFAEYKRLHGLHHANANNPETDPDYFFIKGGRIRAFLTLAFAPEYLFFYVLRKGETQPGFFVLYALRLAVYAAYIYMLGLTTFLLLFFIPAKIAWGLGFMLFSYESHISPQGKRERDDGYNLEPKSAIMRFLLKSSAGPYAYYVACQPSSVSTGLRA